MTDFTPQNPHFLQDLAKVFATQNFMRHIGAEPGTVEPGYVEIVVPVTSALEQHNGVVHGGVVGAIADNAAGGAAATLMARGTVSVTVEYKINFVAPAVGNRLIARARVVKPGMNLTVCRSEVYGVADDGETLCAHAIVTLAPVAIGPLK